MPKTPRSVVRIIDRLNIGGPAIHVTLLSKYLDTMSFSGHSWKTTLIYGQEGKTEGNMLSLVEEAQLTPTYIPSLGRELHPIYDLVSFWKVLRVILREKPSIVHTHKSKAGVIGRLAAFVAGVPVRIHTYHGHVLHGYFGPSKSRIFIWIERQMARLSHSLIAVSPKVKEDLVKYGVAAPDKIKVLYLGLDLEKFAARPRGQGLLRKELGLPATTPIIGIVARLVPIKGVAIFLEAAAQLMRNNAGAHFVVVGDGELRDELEKHSQALGLSNHVHFLGFRSDVENLYPDIDILALTSYNEGSPVSLIEGLAAGCAVVSTQVGGVQDVVHDGETGFLIAFNPEETPAQTGERLAVVILRLLNNPAEQKRLGTQGQHDVLKRFDIRRLAADIDQLYCNALQ